MAEFPGKHFGNETPLDADDLGEEWSKTVRRRRRMRKRKRRRRSPEEEKEEVDS